MAMVEARTGRQSDDAMTMSIDDTPRPRVGQQRTPGRRRWSSATIFANTTTESGIRSEAEVLL
jgi:hypothetical protein